MFGFAKMVTEYVANVNVPRQEDHGENVTAGNAHAWRTPMPNKKGVSIEGLNPFGLDRRK